MSSYKRTLSEASTGDEPDHIEKPAKRRPTVYDAVVGRVSRDGFIKSTLRRPGQPLRPDEILYKSRNAPTRYEETDNYFAHVKLPPGQKLPSGDLLSALHAYISHFYARSQEPVSQKVWKSMDETALLALGILMEETAREVLGKTGDLVFSELSEEQTLVRHVQSKLDHEGESGEDESEEGMSTSSISRSSGLSEEDE